LKVYRLFLSTSEYYNLTFIYQDMFNVWNQQGFWSRFRSLVGEPVLRNVESQETAAQTTISTLSLVRGRYVVYGVYVAMGYRNPGRATHLI